MASGSVPFSRMRATRGGMTPTRTLKSFSTAWKAKRSSGRWSDNIWKNIFWLQQAPAASSADAAYATARKGYLMEIQSRVLPATRLYNDLTAA